MRRCHTRRIDGSQHASSALHFRVPLVLMLGLARGGEGGAVQPGLSLRNSA